MPTEKIMEFVKDTTEIISDKVGELKEDIWGEEQKLIVNEFKENSIAKVSSILENINNSNVTFDKSGFKLSGMEVSLGLPPEIKTEFTVEKQIPVEDRKNILESVKDNQIIRIILNCLFKAQDYYEKIKFGNFKLESIEINLGLIPGINLKFSK